jgi:hypothetical protein
VADLSKLAKDVAPVEGNHFGTFPSRIRGSYNPSTSQSPSAEASRFFLSKWKYSGSDDPQYALSSFIIL